MSCREDQLRAWRSSRGKPQPLQLSCKGNTGSQSQPAPSGVPLRKAKPAARRLSAARRGSDKENAAAGHRTSKPSVASWKRSTESKLTVLTDALQVLKRDSIRPAISGKPIGHASGMHGEDTDHSQQLLQLGPSADAAGADGLYQQADSHLAPGLATEAAQLFGDADLVTAFEHVQSFQLQRTSHGATDKTRIIELAGLVKQARRVLRDLKQKTNSFVTAALAHERQASLLSQAAELNGESVKRSLEAEIAGLKRDCARASSAEKAAAAAFELQLSIHRSEVSHARQELQHAQVDRDTAIADAARRQACAEAVPAHDPGTSQLEARLQQAQQALQQQDQIYAQLQAEKDELAAFRDAAQAETAALREELYLCREERSSLEVKASTSATVCAELTATNEQLSMQLRGEAESLSCAQRKAADASDRVAQLLTRCELLQRNQGQQADLVEEYEQRLHSAHSMLHASRHEAEQAAAQLQVESQGLAEQGAILAEEKMQLKNALAAALEHSAGLEAALGACHRDAEAQHQQAAAVHQVVQTLEQRLADSLASHEEVSRQLQQERESKQELSQQAADKAARLAHMEGEMGALQDAIGTGSMDQADMLSRLLTRVATLDKALGSSQAAQRQLHNQLVELRGNVRVFCRVRPAADSCVTCSPGGTSVQVENPAGGKGQGFSFDHVFSPSASQAAVFAQVSELVQSALDGYQVCLFSYGQTGAGKTYTMEGGRAPEQRGIIPRTIAKMLEQVQLLSSQGWEYSLQASYLEVYNETLRDLLAPTGPRQAGQTIGDLNAIRHDPSGGHTTVAGAVQAPIAALADAEAILKRADQARSTASTAMNAHSSRSHSVLMLHIAGSHGPTGTSLRGSLNLVDLAGSSGVHGSTAEQPAWEATSVSAAFTHERLARSGVEGQRAKEACLINKSLSALGDVFSALSARSAHVPHRNSKLTHLLQPCLGGSGKTMMICSINPEPASHQETLCALRFAAKVNACETRAAGGAQRHITCGALDKENKEQRPAVVQGVKGQAVGQLKRKGAPPGQAGQRVTKARVM